MDKWVPGEGVLTCYNSTYMAYLRVGKVMRVGNSRAIVLPSEICEALQIETGDQVAFAVYENDIIQIRKLNVEELRAMKPPRTKRGKENVIN